MKADILFRNIATQGAVGYGQAPGTIATIMTIPFVWFLSTLHLPLAYYMGLVVLFFILGSFIAHRALLYFTDSDPSAIVIDEMVGFMAVFFAIPITITTLFVGFVLFRLLDIYKPFPISWLDQLPGIAGIMLDDLAAALITNLLLHCLLFGCWL